MTVYNFQLLLKHLLLQGVSWAPQQHLIYRDQLRFTYNQFYQRVLQLAGALQGIGIHLGTRIGVIEWDSPRYLEMYFAIPGAGAVLHTINPSLPAEDLRYTLQHAGDEVLIFHEDFLPLVERLRPALPAIQTYILIREQPGQPGWWQFEYEDLLASSQPLAELPDLDENCAATLLYTTGTTGRPRGVLFTQRQLILQALSIGMALAALGSYGGVNKRDIYMPLTPMFHAHAWGMPYMATMWGLKQVYPGKYEIPLIKSLVQSEGVTFSHCVPTILQKVVAALAAEEARLDGWKVILGGAPFSKALARQALELGIQVFGGYGLSETGPVLTIANLKPGMEAWPPEDQLDILLKPGFPIPLVQLKVVAANGAPVPPDEAARGEVMVRSPWCAPAYLDEPEKSEALWAGGWLHTGDVATVDHHGYIQIVDRMKDLIKSGGEWIASVELERRLCQVEGVQEAAVIGVPDEVWGERPLAFVVAKPEARGCLTAAMLHAALEADVAAGVISPWAVPERYEWLAEIPKTGIGKPDKKALRNLLPPA